MVGCVGVSEPGGGSDVAAVKTSAERIRDQRPRGLGMLGRDPAHQQQRERDRERFEDAEDDHPNRRNRGEPDLDPADHRQRAPGAAIDQ